MKTILKILLFIALLPILAIGFAVFFILTDKP